MQDTNNEFKLKVDLANHERGMAMVQNTKLPLPKTNLLYYRNWTPWTATKGLVIKMAVNRKGGWYIHGTKLPPMFRERVNFPKDSNVILQFQK